MLLFSSRVYVIGRTYYVMYEGCVFFFLQIFVLDYSILFINIDDTAR